MDVTIKINMDNDAFQKYPIIELTLMLKQAIRKLSSIPEIKHGEYITLQDCNGNTVGKLEYTDNDEWSEWE